jgi:hypothetical protein
VLVVINGVTIVKLQHVKYPFILHALQSVTEEVVKHPHPYRPQGLQFVCDVAATFPVAHTVIPALTIEHIGFNTSPTVQYNVG